MIWLKDGKNEKMNDLIISFNKALGIACRINKCHCVEEMLLDPKNKKPNYHLVLDYALALPEDHECKNKCDKQTASGCGITRVVK